MNHSTKNGMYRRSFLSIRSFSHSGIEMSHLWTRGVLPFLFLFSLLLFYASAPDAHSVLNARSDDGGITVEFDLPELNVSTVEYNNVRYQAVSYDSSGVTDEVGNPRLPVSRVVLGVPPNVSFNLEVISATNETRLGYRVPPVPHHIHQPQDGSPAPLQRGVAGAGSTEEIQTFVDEWREDGSAYRTGDIYPGNLAQIAYSGYIRSQRVIYLELHPVQYEAKSRVLRIHPRMVVRVNFQSPNLGSQIAASSPSQSAIPISQFAVEEPKAFEQAFQKLLLNYDEAKGWRVPSAPIAGAPAAQQPSSLLQGGVRYKILVDKTGIYRLTGEDLLQKWGVDLRDIDPRYLHLKTNDKEVPIYIRGEADGRFDRGDYIEFLGLDARNRYTRWNVYWLSAERTLGARVSEFSASPEDPTATVVPVFRSKIHFEEDHLTSNLEHVTPDEVSSGDKHKWFEALDFWYWTGIKNASDYNEASLEFPLYDLAQSFVQPKIWVTLQGGAPTQHEILTSINGVRIDDAKWNSQDSITVERTLRVWDNLRDATKGDMNALTIARIDATTEEDTTRYPYHVYINSFDVEYTRLLKAVNDYLDFSSPQSKEAYAVRKRRKLEYTIQTFLSPDVEIFEYDGKQLTSRLQNLQIEPVNLDRAERDRLRAIFRSQAEGDKNESLVEVPHAAYNATFQVPDSHDAKFIAVSSAGVREPVRVEATPPSDLLSPSNGADYLILSHPVFFEPAQRLAAWRATPKGGGFRTKVVDVTQIYDLFSNGMVNPNAIKEFLKYAYQNWTPPALSYVVIIGDGTFDFRGLDEELYPEPPEVMGYIPTHYIWSSSFGRTATDHWYTTVSGADELPDFYLGRLSAETLDQANEIVDKIINYDGKRPNGSWRRQIISVADDEVNNSGDFIFKKSLTEIAQSHTLLGYETIPIFLEDVIKMVKANPQEYPGELPQRVAKDMVIDALSKGSVIAQYVGHGGRIVWAHEAIFDNASVDLLDQTTHLPFMLVLSCYNGYFDAPGEPSMAEKLLRKEKGGIIGMLSATRLTYGSGNDTLNRIIFDDLFKRNEHTLGPLSFDSKVEQLMRDGLSQIDVMMEYTLFGDPAMKLAMADYEMQPKVETKTVAPEGLLKIASGQVLNVAYDSKLKRKVFTPTSDFNGKLEIKAIFPDKNKVVNQNGESIELGGDVTVTREAQITNGSFPDISIPVPKEIGSGAAHIEYYAEDATHIAVGGDSFTVLVPKILAIQPEVVDDTSFRVSTQISDELGNKGIKEVIFEWQDPIERNWSQVTMTPDLSRGDNWYTTPKPLPLPSNGAAIKYQISITDADNLSTSSDLLEYRPFVLPNLRAANAGPLSDEGLIYYRYSPESSQWTLNVDIEQAEDIEMKENVEVAFFDGNPDLNGDNVVDSNARLLGRTQIRPDAWQRRDPLKKETRESGSPALPPALQVTPLNTNWIATATLPYELPIGSYEIFTWVDPVFDSDSSSAQSGNSTQVPQGEIREGDDTDNLSSRHIQVQSTLIGKSDVRSFSQDEIIDFRVPAGAVPQPAVLTIIPINKQQQLQASQQPSLTPIALPNGNDAVAYRATLGDASQNPQLNQPLTSEIRFDLDALKMEVMNELFGQTQDENATPLMNIEDLPPDQIAAINEGTEQRAKEIGAYLWVDTLGKWVRLNSGLVTSPNGAMQVQPALANVREANYGDGEISNIQIAPTGASLGKWALLFISPTTYRLLTGKDGAPLEVVDPNRSTDALREGSDFKNGVAIDIKMGQKEFQFGDVLTFEIVKSDTTGDENPDLYASSFHEQNRGTGALQYIRLAPNSTIPTDRWVILFVDPEHFQVEGQKTGILSRNGQPVQGTVGEEFADADLGLTLKITQGKWKFETGDSFRFETKAVGRVRSEVPMLGPLTLMRSSDTIPPDIQLTIGNQNFVDGDPVSSEPLIQATLTDDNGIDYITRLIRLEISQDNREFTLIPESEYRLSHRSGANQIILNYQSPKLEPGTYQVRLTASDLDGNKSEREIEFQVHKILQLLRAMNYPNPFKRDTTITCELTGAADEMTVKIYSLSGRLVREFKEDASAGFMMMAWDGRDKDGEEVANGVYYCKVRVKKAGEKDLTEYIKMMKLK